MGLAQAIKLLVTHPRIVLGQTIANWQSGVATSGLAGADLVTMNVANKWCRLNAAFIVTTGFNAAATVTCREYAIVAGAERLVMSDDTVMPEPIISLNWWLDVEVWGPYRVELYSNNVLDNGLVVTYEYRIKDW